MSGNRCCNSSSDKEFHTMSASAGDSYTHNIYGERTSHYCDRSVVCLIGNTIYGVACDSMTSLFQAMIEHLESCILQIHERIFGALGMDATMDNNASPYMEELQKCITHFRGVGTDILY